MIWKNIFLSISYSWYLKYDHTLCLFPWKSLSWHHDPIISSMKFLDVEITNAYDYSWSNLKMTHHGLLNSSAALALVEFKTMICLLAVYQFMCTVCMRLYYSQKHNMTNDHCYVSWLNHTFLICVMISTNFAALAQCHYLGQIAWVMIVKFHMNLYPCVSIFRIIAVTIYCLICQLSRF